MQSIGKLIHDTRKRYGMSQAELARRVGLSKTAMHELEASDSRDPRWSVVAKCARVLGASLPTWALLTVADEETSHADA